MTTSSPLETNADMYRRIARRMAEWGWEVGFAPGWATRTNSSTILTPTQVAIHHTGGYATATSYLLNPRDRPQLKVLANVHITRKHQIIILAAGGASHAGYTHQPCFSVINNGTAPLDRDLIPGPDSPIFSANKRSIGIEVDGAGGSAEWDAWMTMATIAFTAAAQIENGWMEKGGNARVGAHKEHTKRKPGDPFVNMGSFRSGVKLFTEDPLTPAGIPVLPEPEPEIKPTPAPLLIVPKTVRQGSRGTTVTKLQKRLRAEGFSVAVDGIFGPATKRKVKTFQRVNKLSQDGVVGANTWKALLT